MLYRLSLMALLQLLFLMPSLAQDVQINAPNLIVENHSTELVLPNIWILNSLEDVSSYMAGKPKDIASITMAKNESEHFQCVLVPIGTGNLSISRKEAHPTLKFECRSITTFEGKEDILVPCNNQILVNNQIVKLWITYQTIAETPAGEYKEVIRFKGSAGEFIIRVTIVVKDVIIPKTPGIASMFGIVPSQLMLQGLNKTQIEEKKKEVSDLLLTYRTSPYFSTWFPGIMKLECSSSPYEWNDPRTLEYLMDPRFSRIALPFHTLTEPQLKNLLVNTDSKGLTEKAVFYLWDEPTKLFQYEHIKSYDSIIQKYSKRAKIITTFFKGPDDGKHANNLFAVFDLLHGATSIFCTGVWSLQANEDRSAKCKEKIKNGEEWWTYVCMGDRPGLAYNSTAIENRAVMWRNWKEGSNGFLYWAVNSFSSVYPLKSRIELPMGDGILVYPGEPFGSTMPVVSMRLERWRDGAEDYEMLLQMEKIKGRKAAELLLQKVYSGPLDVAFKTALVSDFHITLINEICK